MVWALGSGLITWEQEDAALLDTDCNWLKLRKVDTNDSGSFTLLVISFTRDRSSIRNACQSTFSNSVIHLSWTDQYSVCLNSFPLSHLLVIESLFQGFSLVLGIPVNLPWLGIFCCSLSWTGQFQFCWNCVSLHHLLVWTFAWRLEVLSQDWSLCSTKDGKGLVTMFSLLLFLALP